MNSSFHRVRPRITNRLKASIIPVASLARRNRAAAETIRYIRIAFTPGQKGSQALFFPLANSGAGGEHDPRSINWVGSI
jgi:hypothetical protein